MLRLLRIEYRNARTRRAEAGTKKAQFKKLSFRTI